MIGLEDPQALARDIHETHKAGARLRLACECAGIAVRTLQRWKAGTGLEHGDGRPEAVRPPSARALSEAERAEVLRVANEPRFAEVPPSRIVPMLADEGTYIASESSFARVLREHGQMSHRGRAKAPRSSRPPSTYVASGPGLVLGHDLSAGERDRALVPPVPDPGPLRRKIIGWEVHATDDADHAIHLVRRTALAEGIAAMSAKPVLHGDNGAWV